MQENNNTLELVTDILNDYIHTNRLRKTPERFAILKEIYTNSFGHFSVESLYNSMRKKNYSITKTTLYNSMDIFIDAGLVVKHQFGNNICIYEKIFKRSQHDHLICTKCGSIFEFCDPRILEIQNDIKSLYDFNIDYHSLYIYGLCKECCEKIGKKF